MGSRSVRRAVLDDEASGRDLIVSEGDEIDGIRVAGVAYDSVTLVSGSREWVLRLAFSGRAGEANSEGTAGPTNEAAGGSGRVLGTSRFGEQTQSDRWEFRREKLLEYYQEVLDDPQRLVAIFDSLKPLYDDNRRIHGYVLGVEGEKKFFDDVGLREGDIVRSVNSMPMTSRARAEYFISEFVADRANAFVIEIEREGAPQKLTYLLR